MPGDRLLTILVTGAGGQVGNALARAEAPDGCTLVCLHRAELDISDRPAVLAAVERLRPRLVINAAAYTAVDRAETEPALAWAVNRDGCGNLAVACREANIPLLHISTDYVFDGGSPQPLKEDAPTCPLGVYGASKLAGEETIRALVDSHLILRTSWVFSDHGVNFVKTMLRLGRERSELRVVDDQHGCPTAAGDIAAVLLDIAGRICAGRRVPWGTFHFCGTPATTWCAFARAIFDLAEKIDDYPSPAVTAIPTSDYPTPARRPAWSILDCSKIRNALGVDLPDWRHSLAGVISSIFSVKQS
ncbi:MAG: dTDP-4-dehydrorhamnose reductase [Thermodesulfobacteriota bacterium]